MDAGVTSVSWNVEAKSSGSIDLLTKQRHKRLEIETLAELHEPPVLRIVRLIAHALVIKPANNQGLEIRTRS